MQSFPTVVFDGPELDDMGQKEVNTKIERLTGRVTALENASPAKDHAPYRMGATFYMSLVSLIVTVIGVPIMFLAWIEPHLDNDLKNDVKIEVAEQLRDPLKQIGDIAGDVREIKGKLEVLDPLIQKLTVQRISELKNLTSKDLVARLPELKHLATIAKTEGVTVKPETVEKVGKKLVEAGGVDAWNTALDFLNYKSFLNASLTVKYNSVTGTGTLQTVYVTHSPLGLTSPQLSILGAVPKEQAAQFLNIGEPDPDASLPLGNDWIIADGGGLIIDNMQLKKVIFRNVYISYSGSPLRMQDVYFINCTFAVKQQPNGQGLVMATFKPSPATSFNAS